MYTIWTGFETWRLTAPANSQRPAEQRDKPSMELLVIFPFHLFGHYTWFDQCQHLLRFRHFYPSSFCCPFHPSSTVLFISLMTRIGLIVFDHLTCVWMNQFNTMQMLKIKDWEYFPCCKFKIQNNLEKEGKYTSFWNILSRLYEKDKERRYL